MLPENTTIEEVKEWLTAKKEDEGVKSFLVELNPDKPLTAEKVSEFLNTEDGKALIQPMMDKHTTDGIKTYRTNHYDKDVRAAVAAEILKINPSETPEQKQIRELKADQEKMNSTWEREKLKNVIKEMAFKESINPAFIGSLEFSSEAEAALYIKQFKTEIENAKTAKANELLASGFKPGSGKQSNEGKMTAKEYAKLPQEERIRMVESGEADNLVVNE